MPSNFSKEALITICGHPCLLARPPADYHNVHFRLPCVILLGFRNHETASQSQPTPSRRSLDMTFLAASLANSSDLDGWDLTDNVQPSSEKNEENWLV